MDDMEEITIDDADIPESAFSEAKDEIETLLDEIDEAFGVDKETGEIIPVEPLRPYTLTPLPKAEERPLPIIWGDKNPAVTFPTREEVACVGCASATWFISEQETKTGVQSRLMCKCHLSFKIIYGGESKAQVKACSDAHYRFLVDTGAPKPKLARVYYTDVTEDRRGQECVGCKNSMWSDVRPHDPLTSKQVFCKRLLFDVFGGNVKGAITDCDGKTPSGLKLRPDGFLR